MWQPWATSGGSPGGPGNKGNDAARVVGISNGVRAESTATTGDSVEDGLFVMLAESFECLDLTFGPSECVGRGVIAVGLMFLFNAHARFGIAAVDFAHRYCLVVEVIGGEVGPEISSMAINRAVLHQPIGEKQFLAAADVIGGEHGLTALAQDLAWYGRMVLVDANGQVAEDGKADKEGKDRSLQPERRDRHGRARSSAHGVAPGSGRSSRRAGTMIVADGKLPKQPLGYFRRASKWGRNRP